MGSFGNKFRKARESKKLSFDDVSNVTKIGSRMLKAIEDEDFDQLPGGVFNKGFIRAYAKQLGLDPEEAITDYLASQAQVSSHEGLDSERRSGSDRRKAAAPATSNNAPKTETSVEGEEELPHLHLPRAEDVRSKPKQYLDRPSAGVPWLTIAIILVIASAAALFWVRHSRRERTAKLAAPQMTAIEAAPSGTAVVLPQPVSEQTALSTTTSGESRPATTKPQNGAQKTATTRNNAPAPVTPADSSQTSAAKNNSPNTELAPTPSPKPVGKLTLVIRASENSWISVTSDGQTVTQETLIAPAHTTVHASREITVRVGNAGGVTFIWNGEEIPAQGAEAEVKTLIFDADGMRAAAQ